MERISDERIEALASAGVVKGTPVGKELYDALVAERSEYRHLCHRHVNTAAALDVAQEDAQHTNELYRTETLAHNATARALWQACAEVHRRDTKRIEGRSDEWHIDQWRDHFMTLASGLDGEQSDD